METLMIHNIRKEYFDLDLSGYRLTFDDGLHSQYYYLPIFEKFKGPRYYFITTGFIKKRGCRKMFNVNHLPFVRSREYMFQAFVERNYDPFMTVDEVKYLAEGKNVTIGAHSHFHDIVLTDHRLKKPLSRWKTRHLPAPSEITAKRILNRRSKLAFRGYSACGVRLVRRTKSQWEDFIKFDVESCLDWFEKNLKTQPANYSFPFNEYTPELVEILKSFGFKRFYNGRSGDGVEIFNRLDIDKLL